MPLETASPRHHALRRQTLMRWRSVFQHWTSIRCQGLRYAWILGSRRHRGISGNTAAVTSVTYDEAAGAGGTGRMISDATFQSFPTFIQFMIIRNGLGVPSCPAYETVIFIGA